MGDMLTLALLWVLALGSGLIGGVYFAFTVFVMRALSRLDASVGIAAMNAVNAAIVRSWFLPLFLVTTLAALVLALGAGLEWGAPCAPLRLAAGVIYVLGMFVVTIACNVPMNTALATANPARADGLAIWAHYLRRWTFWNLVRTIASFAASALSIAALTRH